MPSPSGTRNHAVGLDVELLLMPGPVLAFDDHVRLGEALVDRALVDRDVLERRASIARDRRAPAAACSRSCTSAAGQPLAIRVREQQNRLGEVIDLVLGQARLVVVDERDDVAAGDVAEVDDGEAGGVEVEADGVRDVRAESSSERSRPWSMPGNVRSSMYFAAPVTLASESLRRTFLPTARATPRLYTDSTDPRSTVPPNRTCEY